MTNTPNFEASAMRGSMGNLISMDTPPSELQVTSAIKADLARFCEVISAKHVQPRDCEWPDTTAKGVADRVKVSAARDILADVLSPIELEALDALLACNKAAEAVSWGADVDLTVPAGDLVNATDFAVEAMLAARGDQS